MIISELIKQLQQIKKEHGDIEVYKNNDSELDVAYCGYVSDCGQVYSDYDFKKHPKDYPERKMFDDSDKVCII